VPIEHGPLDSAAAALDRQPGQRGKQRLTVPLAAMRRLNEKIFEVNSRLGKEGRIIVEEKSEANDLPSILSQQSFGEWLRPEEMLAQPRLIKHYDIRQFFVLGQRSH